MKSVSISGSAALTGEYQIPKKYIRELRRADPFITYGVLAADIILEKSKAQDLNQPPFSDNCGLFLGSSYGPMETNFDVLDQVINKIQTSPTLFSHSVFNAAAGYLTRVLNIEGQALTITDFVLPFFQALQQAFLALSTGRLEKCIVLQIETYSKLLEDARSTNADAHFIPWPPGVCAFLLTTIPHSGEQTIIEHLSFKTTAISGQTTSLAFSEQLTINDQTTQLTHPLQAAIEVHKALEKKEGSQKKFEILSPFAKLELVTNKL